MLTVTSGRLIMATIRDVARKAGVSAITVSRVINKSGYVSEKTRTRVEAAIVELKYVPNRLAQSLRQKQTDTLALLVADITNPFWTTVARGVEDVASAEGLNVILCNTDESEAKQDNYLNLVIQKQVDGIVLAPVNEHSETIHWIQEQNVPVVVVDRKVTWNFTDVVRCDSIGGAYQLVKHLLSLGHRQIGLLNGPNDVSTAVDRAAGYQKALIEAGVILDNRLINYGGYTVQSGYEMAQQMLTSDLHPTAFFAANNFIAIGALRALQHAGVRVPEDISVVGFDDLPSEIVVEPFLTVSSQPAYEMGRRATGLLLDRIAGKGPEKPQDIVLPTEMIIRASSGLAMCQRER
jgi:LacI family transcriptional regulator